MKTMPDSEKILRTLLDTITKEENYNNHEVKIKAINSGGANYTSELFHIAVSAPDKEDLQLFAKVAVIGEKMREVMPVTQIYATERIVYTKLAKIYKDIQEKHNIAEEDMFKFPKFYGINVNLYEETVVLENLVARGFLSFNRFISVDWAQAASVVEVLAKFHALSFAFQKEQPEKFDEYCNDLVFDMGSDRFKESLQKMINESMKAVKEEYRERVRKFFASETENAFVKYNKPLGNRVMIHGDYRPSNMLYKRKGYKVETIPVDYQTVRIGCPVSDLVYFVFLATDEQFRAEHYERLIEHYYEQLALSLNRLGLVAAETYPRDQFDSELKKIVPYGIFLAVALLPVVMVEEENAPTMAGEESVFDSMVVASNDMYAERLNGIISDFVRWGLL